MDVVEVEEIETARALVNPQQEIEAIKQQQLRIEALNELEARKASLALGKRWSVVTRVFVPAGAIVLGGSVLVTVVFVLNWVASSFWMSTRWF